MDSLIHIKNYTITPQIRLYDVPNGKMLKVNQRNNSLHYRVYQKDEDVRFELEFKHRQTKLVHNYLFNTQLEIFEHQLVIKSFQYSGKVLCLNSQYTNWILDFQRRHRKHELANSTSRTLVSSYFENQRIKNLFREERFFLL